MAESCVSRLYQPITSVSICIASRTKFRVKTIFLFFIHLDKMLMFFCLFCRLSTAHSGLSMSQGNHMSIKSEPISPPRDSTTPSSQHQLRPPSTGHHGPHTPMSGHVSPNPLNHSNSSSPVGAANSDYEPPQVKRPRIAEGWAAS